MKKSKGDNKMALDSYSVANAQRILEANKGNQFYHAPSDSWILSFGDTFVFSSRKLTDEEVAEHLRIAEEPDADDWL